MLGLVILSMVFFVSPAAFGAVVKVPRCDALALPGSTDSASFGYEEISASGLYVIYSGAVLTNTNGSTSVTTSNIYAIKGRPSAGKTLVWVFGHGYGDAANTAIPGDLSDVEIYRNSTTKPARSAKVDACYLDEVIQKEFSVLPNLANLRFIAPHYHLDHINQEFLSELAIISYPMSNSKFYVHERDSLAITSSCNSKCCGKVGSDGKCNVYTTNYWAAPFKTVWESNTLSTLVKLGSESDLVCAKVSTVNAGQISSFQSVMGAWDISVGPADHSRGPLYLSLISTTGGKNYLIKGADSRNGVVDPCESAILPSGTSNVILHAHEPQVGF